MRNVRTSGSKVNVNPVLAVPMDVRQRVTWRWKTMSSRNRRGEIKRRVTTLVYRLDG